MIRVLVVDDEPHARQKLARLIEATPDLDLLGTCQSGLELVQAVHERSPDLVFLDIQMPELGGFEALERIREDRQPYVIFTTAYSEYGAQAFEVEAVDYLLKPFDAGRFERALERARRLIRHERAAGAAELGQHVTQLLEQRLKPSRIMVKAGTGIRPLDPAELLHVQAEGDYLLLKLAGETLRVRERMKDLEARLAGADFLRIHRSVLVNLGQVKELKPKRHGDYEFRMADGARFVSGTTYRAGVRRFLERTSA